MKGKKSLVSKLIITLCCAITITFIITGMVLSYLLEENYLEERKNKINNEAELIERVRRSKENSKLPDVVKFVSISLGGDILVIEESGHIIQESYFTEEENWKYKRIEDIDLGIEINIEELKMSKAIEWKTTNNFIYCKPMFDGNSFIGAIIILTPLNDIKNSINNIYCIIWLSVIIAVLLSSIILYYVSKKIIIKPLETINNAAKKIAQGDIDNKVNVVYNDEIGELAESFNTMATALEEAEKNRREFISNVSHELRSPITSIKGFISAILDGVIPKDKENYYLIIVNDEIQRLTRLITDLLDLSAMQAGKLSFNFSKIDINNIIKTTVIKMQHKIHEKNIKVKVVLEGDILHVRADNDRIIQVVTNLLDNAVKYSSKNGEIKVSTKTKGDKVLVTIYNNGASFSEQDIKYIWERFYKADKSRTNKTSTGLGLSIVRNIILQHGENIWAENSSNGVGVEFCFTLSKL